MAMLIGLYCHSDSIAARDVSAQPRKNSAVEHELSIKSKRGRGGKKVQAHRRWLSRGFRKREENEVALLSPRLK